MAPATTAVTAPKYVSNPVDAVRELTSKPFSLGRSTRSEYWWMFPVSWVAIFAATFTEVLLFGEEFTLLSDAVLLASLVVGIPLLVRRIHDTGRSGHHAWALLVPLLGSLYVLFIVTQPSDPRPNHFGPPPTDGSSTHSGIVAGAGIGVSGGLVEPMKIHRTRVVHGGSAGDDHQAMRREQQRAKLARTAGVLDERSATRRGTAS